MLHRSKLILVLLTLVFIMALMIGSCKPTVPISKVPPTPTIPQKYGGVLKYSIPYAPGAMYPPKMGFSGYFYAMPALEPLLRMDKAGQMQPCLATEWQVSKDLKSVTLTLRKGVKFHDGTDFNAEAVKYNLDASKAEKKAAMALATSVDVVDEFTVRINLSQFDNTFFNGLATTGTGMMASPNSVKTNSLELTNTRTVGTGPFKIKSYTPDVSVTFERFSGYWQKDKPYLDSVEIINIQDPMLTSTSLQSGEVDVIRGTTAETPKLAYDMQQLKFNVSSLLSMLVMLVPDSMNPSSPFANKSVREAVEHAIDRPAITKALGYGFWQMVNQLCAPGYTGYISELQGRPYDPTQAKKLLTNAGYPNGFSTKLILGPGNMPQDGIVAIQRYLKEVNIDAQIEVVASALYTTYQTKGWNNGLLVANTGLTPNFRTGLSRDLDPKYAMNISMMRPAAWENLLYQSLAVTDFESQKKLTEQLVKTTVDEAMIVPLWATASFVAKNPSIRDDGFMTVHHFLWTPENAWKSK